MSWAHVRRAAGRGDAHDNVAQLPIGAPQVGGRATTASRPRRAENKERTKGFFNQKAGRHFTDVNPTLYVTGALAAASASNPWAGLSRASWPVSQPLRCAAAAAAQRSAGHALLRSPPGASQLLWPLATVHRRYKWPELYHAIASGRVDDA